MTNDNVQEFSEEEIQKMMVPQVNVTAEAQEFSEEELQKMMVTQEKPTPAPTPSPLKIETPITEAMRNAVVRSFGLREEMSKEDRKVQDVQQNVQTSKILKDVADAEKHRQTLAYQIAKNEEARAAGKPEPYSKSFLQASYDSLKRFFGNQTEVLSPFDEKRALEGNNEATSPLTLIGTTAAHITDMLKASTETAKMNWQYITGGNYQDHQLAATTASKESTPIAIKDAAYERMKKAVSKPIIETTGNVNLESVMTADLPRETANQLIAIALSQKTIGALSPQFFSDMMKRKIAVAPDDTTIWKWTKGVGQMVDQLFMGAPTGVLGKFLKDEETARIGAEKYFPGFTKNKDGTYNIGELLRGVTQIGENVYRVPFQRAPMVIRPPEGVPGEDYAMRKIWGEYAANLMGQAKEGAVGALPMMVGMLVPGIGEVGAAVKVAKTGQSVGTAAKVVGQLGKAAEVLSVMQNPLAKLAEKAMAPVNEAKSFGSFVARSAEHAATDAVGLYAMARLGAEGTDEQVADAAMGAALMASSINVAGRAVTSPLAIKNINFLKNKKALNEILRGGELSEYTQKLLQKNNVTADEVRGNVSLFPQAGKIIKEVIAREKDKGITGPVLTEVSRNELVRTLVDEVSQQTSKEGLTIPGKHADRVISDYVSQTKEILKDELARGSIDQQVHDAYASILDEYENFSGEAKNDYGVLEQKLLERGDKYGADIWDKLKQDSGNISLAYELAVARIIPAMFAAKDIGDTTAILKGLSATENPSKAMKFLRDIIGTSEDKVDFYQDSFDALSPEATVHKAMNEGRLLELTDAMLEAGKKVEETDPLAIRQKEYADKLEQLKVAESEEKARKQSFVDTSQKEEELTRNLDSLNEELTKVREFLDGNAGKDTLGKAIANRDYEKVVELSKDRRYIDERDLLGKIKRSMKKEDDLLGRIKTAEDALASITITPQKHSVWSVFEASKQKFSEQIDALGKHYSDLSEKLKQANADHNAAAPRSPERKELKKNIVSIESEMDATLNSIDAMRAASHEVSSEHGREVLSSNVISLFHGVKESQRPIFQSPLFHQVLEVVIADMHDHEVNTGLRVLSDDSVKLLRLLELPSVVDNMYTAVTGKTYKAVKGEPGINFREAIRKAARELYDKTYESIKLASSIDRLNREITNAQSAVSMVSALKEVREAGYMMNQAYAKEAKKIQEIANVISEGKDVNRQMVKQLVDIVSSDFGHALPSDIKVTKKLLAKQILETLAFADAEVLRVATDAVKRLTKSAELDEISTYALLSRFINRKSDYDGTGWIAFALNASAGIRDQTSLLTTSAFRALVNQETRANIMSRQTGMQFGHLVSEQAMYFVRAEGRARQIAADMTNKLYSLKEGKWNFQKLQNDNDFNLIMKRLVADHKDAPEATFNAHGELTTMGKYLKEWIDSGKDVNDFVREAELDMPLEFRTRFRRYMERVTTDSVNDMDKWRLAMQSVELMVKDIHDTYQEANQALIAGNARSGIREELFIPLGDFKFKLTKDAYSTFEDATGMMTGDRYRGSDSSKSDVQTVANVPIAFGVVAREILIDAFTRHTERQIGNVVDIYGKESILGKALLNTVHHADDRIASALLAIREAGSTVINNKALSPFRLVVGSALDLVNPSMMLVKAMNAIVINPLQTATITAARSGPMSALKLMRDYVLGLPKFANTGVRNLPYQLRTERSIDLLRQLGDGLSPELHKRVSESLNKHMRSAVHDLSGATNVSPSQQMRAALIKWDTWDWVLNARMGFSKGALTAFDAMRQSVKENAEQLIYWGLAKQAASRFNIAMEHIEKNRGRLSSPELTREVADKLSPLVSDFSEADVLSMAQRMIRLEENEAGSSVDLVEPYIAAVAQTNQGRYDKQNVAAFVQYMQTIFPGTYQFMNPTFAGTYKLLDSLHTLLINNKVSPKVARNALFGVSALMLTTILYNYLTQKTGLREFAKISPMGNTAYVLQDSYAQSRLPNLLDAKNAVLDTSVGGMQAAVSADLARAVIDVARKRYSLDDRDAKSRQALKTAEAKLLSSTLKLTLMGAFDMGTIGNAADWMAFQQSAWDGDAVMDEVTAIREAYESRHQPMPPPSREAIAWARAWGLDEASRWYGINERTWPETLKALSLWLRRQPGFGLEKIQGRNEVTEEKKSKLQESLLKRYENLNLK